MRFDHVARLVLAPALLVSLPLAAQTLPARPVPFEEPVRGGTWKDGELVLGKTTLAGARRMLANAVGPDNPSQIPVERVWEVGGVVMRPRWQYDPGEGYFELFFDDNQRLIYALDRTPRPKISRIDLLSHYPRALRAQQSPSFDQYQIDVQPCVTLTALVNRAKEHVTQFGYAWTCRTHGASAGVGAAAPQGR
jgi:hypothetical protein